MKNTFREIGKEDRLKDSESRISQEKLNSTNQFFSLTKTALPFVLLAFILGSLFIENPWIRAALFSFGIFGLVFAAGRFEKVTQGHLVPLHGAVFPRLIYLLACLFFAHLITKPPYFLGCILVFIGVAYGFLKIAHRNSLPKKSTKNSTILNWIKNIADAIFLQFYLLFISILRLIKLCLYTVVFVFVALFLIFRRFTVTADLNKDNSVDECNNKTVKLSVAHLSDMHAMGSVAKIGLEGKSRNEELNNFFKKNKQQLQQSGLIAITGDITDTGFLDEWLYADGLLCNTLPEYNNTPVIAVVPGNHDINIHLSFDNTVNDLPSAEKKLAWFGLGLFSLREVRLVRYLAFWDKWCSQNSTVIANNELITGRKFIDDNSKYLNDFVDEINDNNHDSNHVEKIFRSTFPSVIKVPDTNVRVYSLNSNASTWHIVANSIGWFDMGQLLRLIKLLRQHPENSGAIFLMHHHLKPGTRNLSHESPSWRKRIEELFMITANAFLFKAILRFCLKQSALVLHGHTHFERKYHIGQHLALCAPSTGYGEASKKQPSCLAYVHDLHLDTDGNISLIKSTTLT